MVASFFPRGIVAANACCVPWATGWRLGPFSCNESVFWAAVALPKELVRCISTSFCQLCCEKNNNEYSVHSKFSPVVKMERLVKEIVSNWTTTKPTTGFPPTPTFNFLECPRLCFVSVIDESLSIPPYKHILRRESKKCIQLDVKLCGFFLWRACHFHPQAIVTFLLAKTTLIHWQLTYYYDFVDSRIWENTSLKIESLWF